MENKKGINIIFLLFAVIIGRAALKLFDFNTYQFEKPGLAVVYIITFLIVVFFLVKDLRKPLEKKDASDN